MAGISAGEDIKKEQLQAFGPNLGPVYHELYNEVVWLHAKWAEYRKLYAKSKKRIDLLNVSASFFFYIIENTLREDVLLHIAKLTDPPETLGKYKNLTLQSLPDLVSDTKLAEELRALIKECLKRCTFVRKLRDKQFAHIDLSHAIDPKANQLPEVTRKKVEESLTSIRNIMNHLHVFFTGEHVGFEHFLVHDDAELLVNRLAIADKYEERQRTRFQEGNPLPEDFENIPEV